MDTKIRILPHIVKGEEGSTPIVLLHGFGGDASTWGSIQTALGGKHRSIAFDLPGHGDAVDWPQIGHAGHAAKAVSAALDALALDRIHLVGHSMGGAIATMIALRTPERIASLTLLAPGGFGPEINHRLLRRYAAAHQEIDIQILLEQFFGWESPIPGQLAAHIAANRQKPGATDALQTIVDQIIDGDVQKVLPREQLADLGVPVKLIWGTQDRVLPTRQSHQLPGVVATHIFERVGHMPHLEIPSEVTRLILENAASGEVAA